MNLLEAALEYAKRGWPVVPDHGITEDKRCTCLDPACRVQGKHPRIEAGRREGSTDKAQITQWWQMWPESNIAIVCGKQSGIVAIDIDPRNGGIESLVRMERRMGFFPPTVISKSGGGGMHILFKHPGRIEMRNRIGLYPGVDVKADGGRIVAPPSRHLSGNRYEWKERHHPDHMLLARLPNWLFNAIQFEKGTGTRRGKRKVSLI